MSDPPADANAPVWRNIRWPQLLYGAVAGITTWHLVQHVRDVAPLSPGGLVGRGLLLLVSTAAFIVYLQNMYRFGLVPDYSLKCRFCNGPVNRYSEFCEHCGADLIAEEKLVPCPKCGVDLYPDTKHCPECGAHVAPKAKGKKGKKPKEPDTASVGWSTPIDATTGFPPPEDERR